MTSGLPYMGSKRKIASKIMDYICANNPNAKYFYDLFGGGGAMSFEALKRHQFKRVVYNELNTGVVELLKKIQRDGVTKDFYQWVSREKYYAHKNDNDWFAGLVKTCWSFGNDQKTYLFGKNIECIKREAHEYLMDNGYDGDKNERLALLAQFKSIKQISGRFDLQQLEQLEQLERLERLELRNESYANVVIDTPVSDTVIYLDPPYKGTEQYQEKLNHDFFDEFVQTSPFKIYVSGYDSELPCVFSVPVRSTFSRANNAKQVVEKLFCNQEEKK